MKESTEIRSLDVPQADSLPLIRKVVEAVNANENGVPAISEYTGFSERHVRYRLQGARILGLLTEDLSIAPLGRRLIKTMPGSLEEREAFRDCIRTNRIMKCLAPTLLENEELQVAVMSKRIQLLAGLSPATADRRAVVLRAWHRQLVEADNRKKESV